MKAWPLVRNVGAALLMVAWAVAAHFTSASGEPSGWGAALALAPLVAAAGLALWRWKQRWLAALLALAGLAGLVVFWAELTSQVALLYYVQHIGIYCLLASFFGRSLNGPGESLVTKMARRVHGGVLSPAQAVYTRKVTVAWSLFFVAMALVSTVLFFAAPLTVWSTFANLLGGPLIGAMFVCELVVRRIALPNEARSSIAEMARAWRSESSKSNQ